MDLVLYDLLKKKLILYYLLESVGSRRVERRDANSYDLDGCRVLMQKCWIFSSFFLNCKKRKETEEQLMRENHGFINFWWLVRGQVVVEVAINLSY